MNGGVSMFLEDVKRVRFVLIIRGKFAFVVKNWWSLSNLNKYIFYRNTDTNSSSDMEE